MVTVCLTSYGERLKEICYKAVKSLFTNTFKPDRVIIYLAEKDVKNYNKNQFNKLPVEVRIVPDYMSHKKFFGLTDRSLDDDYIVIVDDDLQYKPYFWQKLWDKYNEHKEENNFIVCNRAQTLTSRKYLERKFVLKNDADEGRFIYGSGAGLLIPPHVMRIEEKVIEESFALCPHCDETFYSAWCLVNGIKTFCTGKPQPFYPIPLPKKDPNGLWDKYNKWEKDITFQKVFEYFGLPLNIPVIVSFTSWTKRIQYAAEVVKRMKRQTYKPTKIILTLSLEEFPNKLKDLPDELVKLQSKDFEIRWTQRNTKTYKKLLPLLDVDVNDWLLIVDDDVEYPTDFIQTMINSVDGCKNPITGSSLKTNYRQFGNVLSANGAFTLIQPKHCLPAFKTLSEYCLNKQDDIASDPILTYSVFLNGYKFEKSVKDYRNLQSKSDGKYPCPYSGGKDGRLRSENTHRIIQEYLKSIGK